MVYIHILLISILGISLSSPKCEVEKNFCLNCHSITNLCTECKYETLIPDDEGGCKGIQTCYSGKNYCNKCDEDEDNILCKECENGFSPDKNGACSYTNNCEISINGNCIQCQSDYYLIGSELKICKYMGLDDFQNCKKINYATGLCLECEEEFFLDSVDKKCVSTEHCSKSSFGVCTLCDKNYILNKKKEMCEEKSEELQNCKITLDGKECDECDDGFYFSEDGNCIKTNFCEKTKNNECIQCKEDYFLSEDKLSCTNEENCSIGDSKKGLCNWCKDDFYLEKEDRKCKSSLEKEELKYCKLATNGICNTCDKYHYLGEDSICSLSPNCAESENDLCVTCSEGFYLGKDGICTNLENCIYSKNNECIECKDGFYYDRIEKDCKESKDNFKNCKYNNLYEENSCAMCKDDFYLNLTNGLCYSNKEEGPFYKCQMTDFYGDSCSKCVGKYYLGKNDLKCNLIEGCLKSENEKKCLECNIHYVLDNEGNCVDNFYITDKDKPFYYNCRKLNEEGTGCAICENGLNVSDTGICYDYVHCEDKEEEICTKCQKKNSNGFFSYCLNDVLGCVDTFLKNCIKCDDILELDSCTECEEGFDLDENGECVLREEE